MAVNPLGAVQVFDGGVPRTISANAAIGVTGGQLVYLSGALNAVSSGANSYATADIFVIAQASGTRYNGIVLTPGLTASGTNNYVTVATEGCYLLAAGSDVYAGGPVEAIGGDNVMRLGSFAVPTAADDPNGYGRKIGRALTGASSGTANYALIQLTP